MNLCSDGHEEVCYEGRNCPACSLRDEKDMEITALEEKIQKLDEDIESLKEA